MSRGEQMSDSSRYRNSGNGIDLPAIFSPENDGKKWYVIRSKQRQESVCLDELAKAGIEGLCPLRMEYRFRRRKQEAVPLFPGYVFCRIRFPEEYHNVRWLRGILHLVQFGDAPPPPVDDKVMRYFADNMDKDGVVKTEMDLAAGKKIEFLDEPLRGLVGTVLRIDSAQERVHVLMDLLYQATIEVDTYQVQAI